MNGGGLQHSRAELPAELWCSSDTATTVTVSPQPDKKLPEQRGTCQELQRPRNAQGSVDGSKAGGQGVETSHFQRQ